MNRSINRHCKTTVSVLPIVVSFVSNPLARRRLACLVRQCPPADLKTCFRTLLLDMLQSYISFFILQIFWQIFFHFSKKIFLMVAERHRKVLFRTHSGLILCIVKIGEAGSPDCWCRSNSLPLLPYV